MSAKQNTQSSSLPSARTPDAVSSIQSQAQALDEHELLLLIAWRRARHGRRVGWYFEFNLTVAGLPKVTHELQISELLTREDLAAVLALTGSDPAKRNPG